MWVIPVDKEESSHEQIPVDQEKRSPKQFSLKQYKQSGYLTCMQSKGGIKAIVRKGGREDIDSGNEFRVDDDKCLASKPTL